MADKGGAGGAVEQAVGFGGCFAGEFWPFFGGVESRRARNSGGHTIFLPNSKCLHFVND